MTELQAQIGAGVIFIISFIKTLAYIRTEDTFEVTQLDDKMMMFSIAAIIALLSTLIGVVFLAVLIEQTLTVFIISLSLLGLYGVYKTTINTDPKYFTFRYWFPRKKTTEESWVQLFEDAKSDPYLKEALFEMEADLIGEGFTENSFKKIADNVLDHYSQTQRLLKKDYEEYNLRYNIHLVPNVIQNLYYEQTKKST